MDSYLKELVANIKYYRQQRGISQAKLAEYCDCSDGMIGLIESEKAKPSIDLLLKISEALQVHPADLFLRHASKNNAFIKDKIEKTLIDDIHKILAENFNR